MNITIRTRHLELTPEMHDQVRDRIAAALDRLATSIQAVDVTITDINGPRGGLDKHCRIRVRGPSLRTVVIEHLGADTLAVTSVAAERAEQAVIRGMARGGRRRLGSVLGLLASLRRGRVTR